MGVREARRLAAVEAATAKRKEDRISSRLGALKSALSQRQFQRLKARYRELGAAAVVHGNRGRPSPRRLAEAVRAEIQALLLQSEPRLNDCHIRDLLAERGTVVSRDTVRRVRRALGLAPKRRRRPAQHRRRRERAAQRGAMVLIDGSLHHWLGSEQPRCTLVGMIDDASGEILSLVFRPGEDLHGYVLALRRVIRDHGVPATLYGDRTAIAVRSDPHWSQEEELEGRQRPTHFGQILEELGIRYIAARSPQAKGRIERAWQTLQDRLVAELALHGITTLEAAEAFVPEFMARYRAWFGRTPRRADTAFRSAPRGLDDILACRYRRVVGRDNVVTFFAQALAIPPGPHRRSYFNRTVEVRERLDGRLRVFSQGAVLAEWPAPAESFTLIPRATERGRARARSDNERQGSPQIASHPAPQVAGRASGSRRGQITNIRRPTKHHPWKQPYDPNLRPSSAEAEG